MGSPIEKKHFLLSYLKPVYTKIALFSMLSDELYQERGRVTVTTPNNNFNIWPPMAGQAPPGPRVISSWARRAGRAGRALITALIDGPGRLQVPCGYRLLRPLVPEPRLLGTATIVTMKALSMLIIHSSLKCFYFMVERIYSIYFYWLKLLHNTVNNQIKKENSWVREVTLYVTATLFRAYFP